MTSAETVFVGAEYEENLAIRTMAAVARAAGVSSCIVGFGRERDLPVVLARILEKAPALVGLSMAFQHRASEFLSLAAALRHEGYEGHIVAGGHFPTSTAETLLGYNPAIDAVVRFDGERPLAMLLERLDHQDRWSEIPSLCWRDGRAVSSTPPAPVPRDLDDLPWPVRDTPLSRHMGVPFTTLCASRGCYGNCTFCAINSYHRGRPGPRLRLRSPGNVAREMAMLYHDMGARIFCFHDDTWFLPSNGLMRARMDELADRLGDLGVRGPMAIVAKARPDALDRKLLDHLVRRLGLMRLYVGVENFSQAGLEHLGRRVTREQIASSLECCEKSGVYGCYNLLLFEPDSRLEDVQDNLDGIRRFATIPVNFCRAEAYNGTAMHRRLQSSGRLRGNYLASDYEIADPRMETLFRIVYQAFKDRNFAEDALANLNMSLGYELSIIRHFAGKEHIEGQDDIEAEVTELVRDINLDTHDRLAEALAFVSAGRHADSASTVSFTIDLASRVNFQGAALHTRLLGLRDDLKRMATRLPSEARPQVETSGARAAIPRT